MGDAGRRGAADPPAELLRALAALAEPPGAAQARIGDVLGLPGTPDPAEYTNLLAFQLYPYASVYCGAEGMLGGEARDRVAGFWRALGRIPPPEPDHLSALLALYAALADQEAEEPDRARALLRRQSRKALLWEHLASWLFPYLDALERIASPFYRRWAALLREALAVAAGALGPPDGMPLHLRAAPGLPDPRAHGAAAFLHGLLAPVRSGIILVRADLARAAREMGLGLRIGERRFVLESLLAQDPGWTLAWLAREAGSWVVRHRAHEAATGPVAGFWAGRAEAASRLLGELASCAPAV